ncbi:putative ring finger protein [Botrytis fragariae]|uniref:Putative ring finger protein n=1 Tax=Botrytis fragariae TaxID=1964551 RepID=A0A8H6ASN8_9HELO|nr:putative ring finger protein [Botrytis fragariae]KAF5872764.1 putative ring finger protein [Botrytis fragariae]
MSRAAPVNHTNGPPRDKQPYIQNAVNNLIEISDSDSEGYGDAFNVPQVPAHPPHLNLQHHQLGGYFGANNQIFDLEDNNLVYPGRLPQPAVAAAPEHKAMARNPSSVKNEEGEMNWAQWMDEENDEGINRVLLEDYTFRAEYNRASQHSPSFVDPSRLHQPFQPSPDNLNQPIMETKTECINSVVAVFPEICRDHVNSLYEKVSFTSGRLIAHILDQADTGTPYPKAKDVQKQLKRKRVLTEEEEAVQKYEAAGRIVGPALYLERTLIRSILSFEFPVIPLIFVDETLRSTGHRLFSAYRTLEEADRTFDPNNPSYRRIKTPRKMPHEYQDGRIEEAIQKNESPEKTETLKELLVCRKIRKTAESRRLAEQEAILAEEENLKKAEAEGTMSECCCCFSDYPLNRMVHCNNEEVLHWFCRGCARQSAETEIGNSKYLLMCMSTDGCEAGFSLEQRNQFLDELTIVALERNEAEAVLRMAGIENLASCPFCPFAAEYPPVEVNREFRCQAPDCEKVSCRLCKLESHIPMTCEENTKANGLSIRRQIEEAMSAAMIRTCNKCGTPFVKEEGCNKMTCTRNGCYNVQCYVCSKSCNYDHFNDVRRGGKEGNCPLFESVEERHNDEVKKAEKEALDKVRAEHPEYSEEDLRIKMSENVTKDDERRKVTDPRNPYAFYRPVAMVQPQELEAWPRDHDLYMHRARMLQDRLRRRGPGVGRVMGREDGKDGRGGDGEFGFRNMENNWVGAPQRVDGGGDEGEDENGDGDGDVEMNENEGDMQPELPARRMEELYWNQFFDPVAALRYLEDARAVNGNVEGEVPGVFPARIPVPVLAPAPVLAPVPAPVLAPVLAPAQLPNPKRIRRQRHLIEDLQKQKLALMKKVEGRNRGLLGDDFERRGMMDLMGQMDEGMEVEGEDEEEDGNGNGNGNGNGKLPISQMPQAPRMVAKNGGEKRDAESRGELLREMGEAHRLRNEERMRVRGVELRRELRGDQDLLGEDREEAVNLPSPVLPIALAQPVWIAGENAYADGNAAAAAGRERGRNQDGERERKRRAQEVARIREWYGLQFENMNGNGNENENNQFPIYPPLPLPLPRSPIAGPPRLEIGDAGEIRGIVENAPPPPPVPLWVGYENRLGRDRDGLAGYWRRGEMFDGGVLLLEVEVEVEV